MDGINGKLLRNKVQGDVRNITNVDGLDDQYDIVLWWHGPEHVKKEEFADILAQLKSKARLAVVVGCPHGQYRQGASYGNISPQDFVGGW